MSQSLAAMLAFLLTVPDHGLGPHAFLFFKPGSTVLAGPDDRLYFDEFPGAFVQNRRHWPWVVAICAGREDGSAAAARAAKARARLVRRHLRVGGVGPIELWPYSRCRKLRHMDEPAVFLMTETRWPAAKRAAEPVRAPCPPRPQPLAPALDSVARLPEGRSSVAFSAEPSLEHPGRAWVVRAHQPRPGDATLEILRLRRRSDCNVYDVETRWQAPLPAADYRALVRAAERVGAPRPGAFSDEEADRDLGDLVTDGTMIELRLKR
ncbi:MAG TPA: hypothetical protein VF619_08480, partial [Allosphingosinicella sp.]